VIRRVGLIGDVHGEASALEAALDELERDGVDALLCVGDIVDGVVDVDRCCRLLEARGVLGVAGNHERWLLEGTLRDLPDATPRNALSPQSLEFLRSLPKVREIETASGKLLLCHGLGHDDMNGLKPDDFGYQLEMNKALTRLLAARRYRWVLAGHTHQRMVREIDGIGFVNAGTLHRDFSPCFCRIDFAEQRVSFVAVDARGKIGRAEERPLAGEFEKARRERDPSAPR
jgi:predicted phosphodiesterase